MQLAFCVVLLSCYLVSSADSSRLDYEGLPDLIPVDKEHIKEPELSSYETTKKRLGLLDSIPADKESTKKPEPFSNETPKKRLEERQFRHDYVYRREAKGWFKFHEIPATWATARAKCFHEGAVLASPINNEVHSAMQDILKDQGHMAFTGIQSLTSSGDYFSIEGVHLIQMPVEWRSDEPNNLGDDEHCVAMWRDGTIADVRCSDTRRFICYKNKTKDLPINSCGTTDKGYLEVAPGQCYKYHPYCVDWRRAHMICSSEGGHLAIVNSDGEARLLHELFASKFLNTVKCSEKTYFHLGFRNPDGPTTGAPYWFTLQGDTLEEAGFEKWGPGQPDNYGNQEYCGSGLFRQPTDDVPPVALNDAPCSLKMSFICEINGARTPYTDEEH